MGYGTSSDSTRQKFGAKERDTETGLDFFEARYYNGAQGRFISPDEFAGGPTELFAEVAAHNPTFYADIASPQSLNKYQYCLNDPLRFVDPDGHQETLADRVENRIATVGAAVTNYYIGAGKAWDNIRIGIKNINADMGYGEHEAPHEATNKAQAVGMIVVERGTLFGGLLIPGSTTGAVMTEGETTTVVAAEAGTAEESSVLATSRAARREAMRQEGIPTSHPAVQQSGANGNRQYVVEGADSKPKVVTQHPPDKAHPNPHWHAATPKMDNGAMRTNQHGQIKYHPGGSTVQHIVACH
jgi:RHS repeat-associated protein